MYDEHLKLCLIKLVQNLRDNALNNRGKITLFLGAGCSLSSSNEDITTYGIIKDIVTNYSYGKTIPEEWTKLYEFFTNNVWSGQGNIDRINLLERYFKDMHPSNGYQCVRSLIEKKYINNIITTNFDPMLDEVLDGLSYNLMVGTTEEIIGENPQFTLLKPHGDLKRGQLRFVPSELYKLPAKIEERIHSLTDGIVIIVGYRGQDMGIIQALNDLGDHCAYWITYTKPDIYQEYENGPIFTWLKKRDSENNLLYGSEYGNFDIVFEKICQMLQYQSEKKQIDYYTPWQKSYLNDYFTLNSRFQNIFVEMLKILEDAFSQKSWKPCSLYYAESHNVLVETIINLLNEKIIPTEILFCISNELDSLLFAVSIEVWSLCQGYSIINTTLVDILQKKYLENISHPAINEDFWDAVKWLSGLTMSDRPSFDKSYCEILVSLNQQKSFQVILKRVSLLEFSSFFLIIQRLLLFVKTGNRGIPLLDRQYKEALEQHLYQIKVYEKQIDIWLNVMSTSVYQEIYNNLLKKYFSENIMGNRHTLHFDNMYVNIDVEPQKVNSRLSIVDEIITLSEKMKTCFLEGKNTEGLLKSEAYNIILAFLKSESNGLFVLGESGIGKTCILRKIISELEVVDTIILPIAAKEANLSSDFIKENFGDELVPLEQIEYINIMLEQRRQTLLLVIDAINEINAPLQQIISIYKNILEYCDNLSKKDLKRIRIIVTCRTDFYYKIQNSIHLQPSPSSFFSKVDNQGNGSTLCEVSGFNKEDVTVFIDNYSLSNTVDITTLFLQYGDMIYVPIYLDMICKINSGAILDEKLPNVFALYQMWFRNIVNTAETESVDIECLKDILNTAIYLKYFCDSSKSITTSQLFISTSILSANVSHIYEWLVKHGVFKSTVDHRNTVFFAHDKIEEFFLIQYIGSEFDFDLNRVYEKLNSEQQKSIIVQNCICTALQILHIKDIDKFRNNIVSIIDSNNNSLISILAEILLENLIDTSGDLYTLLKYLEQFVCKSTFENFISFMYSKINEKIDLLQYFNSSAIECMDKYINNSTMGGLPLFAAMNFYSYARYIWNFPLGKNHRNYSFAIQLCLKFRTLDTDALPSKLVNKNDQQLAILLRNQGDINGAVQLMEPVYQNLYDNACFDEACQALLELGAMYRELTLFDKALALYENYDTGLLHNNSLIYRLYMNTGIIYKNKVQNDLFHQQITEDTYKHYNKSKELFDTVYDFAETSNDIPLQLEILAELIENTVVGYYLNLTTISVAIKFAEEMDNILPKYPVPVRKIQKFRMWARIFTLQGKKLEAIEYLRQGFEIAVHYNIQFRAADCCNQISGILCDSLNSSFITAEILEEGIKACKYSIDYYTQLQDDEHMYLNDSRQKLETLQRVLNNMT